ncbi:MAG: cyclase family protein [Desulfatiglandales bacterium]
MQIIDISIPISSKMILYPGDTVPQFRPICTLGRSGCNMTELTISTHTGTHIDAPSHFLERGKSIDSIELERFIGEAQVLEVKGGEIDSRIIEREIKEGVRRILFKTTNSSFMENNTFSKRHAHLTMDGARAIVSKEILLVGIDYVTVERFGTPDFSVHKTLLCANIPILEGLNLASVEPGLYRLIALPLRFEGLDGSPVRAVLIRD